MSSLCLAMIVKNEARDIARTLESVKPAIDSWVICDTGSTDGTPHIVESVLAGVPGRVEYFPFDDFSSSRNRALDFVEDTFSLMLDGGDRVAGADRLKMELAARRDERHVGGYFIPIEFGGHSYKRLAVLRTSHRWRYAGVTHEVIEARGPTGSLSGVAILHEGEPNVARWQLDLQLLTRTAPGSARDQFYLAQTLECLGRYPEAMTAYRERCLRGGWWEEVFESLYRVARCAQAAGFPWPEIQQLYLDAYNFAPHRAEPLRAIARHYEASVDNLAAPLAKMFNGLADALPFPENDLLFVDRSAYKDVPAL